MMSHTRKHSRISTSANRRDLSLSVLVTFASWLKFIDEHAPEKTVRVLVGNNAGNASLRQVSEEDGRRAAMKNKMLFVETDFRTGKNVDLLFETCVDLGEKYFGT